MKNIYTLLVALIISGSLTAQTPQSFKYQAVVRDASGNVVADQAVSMQISILQGSTSGTAVYVETFTPTTNDFGLINLNIGAGTLVSGDLTTIDWSIDTYFIKVEMDITGGTTYEEYGTSQLLSVPYALHAKTAANIFSGNYSDLTGRPTNLSTFTNDAGYLTSFTETDPVFGAHAANGITSTNITNWTTAYGWGDHSLAGYLTSFTEADPNYCAWDKSTGISITENQITDLDHFTTADETDPVFGAWDKSTGISITESQISDLDHFTTADETDPVYTGSQAANITATDITNLGNLSNTNTGDQDISGITSNATAITSIQDEQTTQDAAIALNTAKDTTGIYHTNRTALDAVSGVNTGNEDLTPYAKTADLSGVATSGNYSDLTNKPDLWDSTYASIKNTPDLTLYATKAYVDALEQQIEELQIVTGIKVKDIDGNIYGTVTIGTQTWMVENLKTTSYNDGTTIPLVTDNTVWSNSTTPAYCWYNNDEATYGNTYGALYNWYVVETGNVCPTGWHVPTDAEWTILTDYLGGTSVAGGKLKDTGTTHWTSPNTGATNETGFTALPGGCRGSGGSFDDVGRFGYWWSSTEISSTNAWFRVVNYLFATIVRSNYNKEFGFSVRCLRD